VKRVFARDEIEGLQDGGYDRNTKFDYEIGIYCGRCRALSELASKLPITHDAQSVVCARSLARPIARSMSVMALARLGGSFQCWCRCGRMHYQHARTPYSRSLFSPRVALVVVRFSLPARATKMEKRDPRHGVEATSRR
jgi:hypothetical protein